MALAVDRYELGPIGTNGYVVRADATATEAVVFDPGGNAAELRLELAQMGATCAGILVTHTHWDHMGGVADLAEGTGAPVYAPEEERDVIERPNDYYTSSESPSAAGGRSTARGRRDGRGRGHLVRGRARSRAFTGSSRLLRRRRALLRRRALRRLGRPDRSPAGDWDTLLESIRMLVERYPPETVVYSGHGPPTTLGDELSSNPFLAELRKRV